MKKSIAVFAGLFCAVSSAGAQTLESAYESLRPAALETSRHGAALAQSAEPSEPEEKPKDAQCKVCWDSAFAPLNEKAKAVKAWEDKKTEVSAAKGVVGVLVFAALLSPAAWNQLKEGQQRLSELSGELFALRAKAVQLGGLELKDDVVIKIKLVKGADYSLVRK